MIKGVPGLIWFLHKVEEKEAQTKKPEATDCLTCYRPLLQTASNIDFVRTQGVKKDVCEGCQTTASLRSMLNLGAWTRILQIGPLESVSADEWIRFSWGAELVYDEVYSHHNIDHVQIMHTTGCLTIFLEPHMWFIAMIEIILSSFGMIFNCAVVVATYFSTPISVLQRRSLAMLSANYALISGLHLARNCFYIFAIHNPCITIVTTINCKLQEFPLVFLYLHGAVVPIIIALQAFFKHKDNYQTITWTNACTINQTVVLVLCIVLSLLFTAFDDDKVEKHLLQCSIVLAIQQKEIAFSLITVLIVGHSLALLVMQTATSCSAVPIDFRHFLNHSLRDLLAIESFAWEFLLFFTGVFAVYEFIALSICERCLSFALELTFIILPLCVCCANPLLVIWIVLPVRNAAIRLCPKLKSVLPEYDMPTPPLPTPDEETIVAPVSEKPKLQI